MITLYQHPVSPFCITIEAILRYAKVEYRIVNLPYSDRRMIVEKTKGAYYKIPLLEDGETIVWDTTDLDQEIARYLDGKFKLALFPPALEGIQSILARYIERDLEDVSFKLNDIHYESWLLDLYDRTMWLRHKERKFGRGCVDQWREHRDELQRQLEEMLSPLDQMLSQRSFLVDDSPKFVDYDLLGVIGNLIFSGHNTMPTRLRHLQRWHEAWSNNAWSDGP
jgi:glutathione S-transferase